MAKHPNPELAALETEVAAGVEPLPIEEGEGVPPDIVDLATFSATFVGAFNIASAVTGLVSLRVDAADPRAEAAATAVYEIAVEVPAFRWLIQPGNPWVGRVVALTAFAVPLARGVKAELAARRAAANDDDEVNGADEPVPASPGT